MDATIIISARFIIVPKNIRITSKKMVTKSCLSGLIHKTTKDCKREVTMY